MIKFLIITFLFFSSYVYGYDEEEIICIATYELAKNFFLDMKDKKTSQEMEIRQQKLFDKYDEGHFPQDDIDFMVTEIHYAWSNNFDFLPPILENCVENIN
jgi:hypothetical protein